MRLTGLLRGLAAAAALAAAALAVPASSPQPVLGVGPLPECRLDDILTEPRGYDDWATTQVDWILSLGSDYRPPDLVSVYAAGVTGGGSIREVAFDDLKAMAAAAKKAGVPLGNVSAYRSYKQQVKLFNIYVRGYGFDEAIGFSARPGHSEHQTGLTIDFAAAGSTKFVNETTATGKWLAKHGWEYGWLMSYPKGKTDLTCYDYEPWHYRYVGRDLAEKIHDSGLTIREYLWANFTQVDPDCVAAPAPTIDPDASPSPRSCAIATSAPPATVPPATDAPSGVTPGTSPPSTSGAAGSSAPTAAPGQVAIDGDGTPGIVALAVVVVLVGVGGLALYRRRS